MVDLITVSVRAAVEGQRRLRLAELTARAPNYRYFNTSCGDINRVKLAGMDLVTPTRSCVKAGFWRCKMKTLRFSGRIGKLYILNDASSKKKKKA